ncbi:MAG TPA: glucose-1-phosphate cytidylyltransferase [Anaerolineales bacterium]|nr:glucose-1-phosphate cytidylyltransferase [Anaerolineales bacterium]
MKVVILAGGLGTRLQEETVSKPKPMVEVGGKPLLWHIMNIYAAQGFNEFIIALGYRSEVIKSYFLNFHAYRKDLTISLHDGRIDIHDGESEDWIVHLVDTGISSQTGGRLKRLAKWLGNGTFMMTYGDGVGDVDLNKLIALHRASGTLATVTAVHPPSRFGELIIKENQVSHFDEKPQTGEGWINGGFFVLECPVLDYIEDDFTPWERAPLQRLAAEGQLNAYKHRGFWQSMDTLRDVQLLERLWAEGNAPWKIWK